jgi:hypothetical protein
VRLIGKLQHEWRLYKSALAARDALERDAVVLMQAAFYVGALAMYAILSTHRRDEAFPPLLIQYMNNLCVKAAKRSSQSESSV